MQRTQVRNCNAPKCVSEFQDREYGKNQRVMNVQGKSGATKGGKDVPAKDSTGNHAWCCTVCATVHK